MAEILAKLSVSSALLLVIDLQEKLLPAIYESQACLAGAQKLLQAAGVLQVPIVVTEQYPHGLGPTCPLVRELLGDAKPVEKLAFSACTPEVAKMIEAGRRRQIIVAGIEAHVCVQQSVLDLRRMGLDVWVCADAVSSRRAFDRDIALDRMRQAGAVITTAESVIFELLGQAGGELFKQILKIVK